MKKKSFSKKDDYFDESEEFFGPKSYGNKKKSAHKSRHDYFSDDDEDEFDAEGLNDYYDEDEYENGYEALDDENDLI